MTSRSRLLNPGPVTLTERVRSALLREDLCHREPEFTELQDDVRSRLEGVYESSYGQYSAVLLSGSGTAAVEAMVGSLAPRDASTLVISNGVYGERIAFMLERHGKPFEVVKSPWTSGIDLAAIESRLEERRFTHAAVIHHETTTGRLNDLEALGALCSRRGVKLLIDAVSSFGAEAIDFEAWNVHACAATANKCLHGVPGLAFVLARREALTTETSAASTLYLDLFTHYKAQSEGSTAFTPAVPAFYALQEALREFSEAGGWQARRNQYRERSRIVRNGFREIGFRLLLGDEAHYSSMLTSFCLPDGLSFNDVYAPLKARGFVIYPGQHVLKQSIFRIAVMGDLSSCDMEELVSATASTVTPKGFA